MPHPSDGLRPEPAVDPPWQAPRGYPAAPRDFYSEVHTTHQAVRELSAQLESLREVLGRLDDHETRLRDLERRRWPHQDVALMVAVAAVILPFFHR